MTNLNICLLSLEIEWGKPQKNVSRLEDALSHIHPDTDLVVIPETFPTGFPIGMTSHEVGKIAEPLSGQFITYIREACILHNTAIAGTFVSKECDRISNKAFFAEPSGEITFSDKRHLFSMAGENEIFSKGTVRNIIRYRGWNIAQYVCYDLRFPIWCRNVNNSCDLMIFSANWPDVRIDAWNKLLPARAIENLCYVAGVNCRGIDPKGFNYNGSSHILDFKGMEIASGNVCHGTPFLYASLSKEKLERFRERFPAHLDADSFQLNI